MRITLTTLALLTLSTTTAFSPRGTFLSRTNSNQRTQLYAGIEGIKKKVDPKDNPEEYIDVFIQPPESMTPRSEIEGTVVVSGWVNAADRSDQFVFDVLNNHDGVSAFQFEKIVALVDDAAFAKKRLLSRSARYTGLLDKLDIVQAVEKGALPALDTLQGASSWVVHLEADTTDVNSSLSSIASLSRDAGIKNVAVMISNVTEVPDASAFASADVAFTVMAVGALDDKKKEGSVPYRFHDLEGLEDSEMGMFPRDEAVRILAESLGLQSSEKRAVALKATKTDDAAAKLIKGLRAAGYSRPQEINNMMDKGVEKYEQAIADYKQKKWEEENPDPEVLRKQKEEEERQMIEQRKKAQEEFEQNKKDEIEETAREWAKREYFRKSLGGNMGMTEEEYIESVWDRAMFEGDLKYRMMHGGDTDERAELAEFLAQQEKKKQAALKRAQKALDDGDGGSPVGAGGDDDSDSLQ